LTSHGVRRPDAGPRAYLRVLLGCEPRGSR
jgi:hypothetical protein